jgi:hypothetical protein
VLQREFPSTHIKPNTQHHPSVPADSWVLLNGSPPWVSSILPVYASSCRCLVGLTAAPIPWDFPWETHLISSVRTGSVVSHKWLFFSIPSIAPPPAPAMYVRPLAHIVGPTTRTGHPSHATVVPQGLLSSEQLPLSSLHSPVHCRSVFSRSGSVCRCLSSLELGRAFDMPPWLSHAFPNAAPSTLPWLSSPPIKVLVYVGDWFLRGGPTANLSRSPLLRVRLVVPPPKGASKPRKFLVGIVSENDGSVVGESEDTLSGLSRPFVVSAVSGRPRACEKGETPRDAISKTPEAPPLPVSDSHELYAQEPPKQSLSPEENEVWLQQYTKSVKADDAATPIHLWDERVWGGNSHEDSVLAFKASFNECPLSFLRLFLLR